MQVGIEFLAQRLEFLHPVLLQHLRELTLGQLDAVEQRLGAGVRLLPQFRVERSERTVHVVGDGDDIAREGGDAVEARVGDLALGPPAQILHFGEHAQQLVLVFGGDAGEIGRVDGLFGRLRGEFRGLGLAPRVDGRAGVRVRHHIVPHWRRSPPDIRAGARKINPQRSIAQVPTAAPTRR